MRPTDLALLRTPGVPTVSPDGRIAVVAVTRLDLEADLARIVAALAANSDPPQS